MSYKELLSSQPHIEEGLLDQGHLPAFGRLVDDDLFALCKKVSQNVAVFLTSDEVPACHIFVIYERRIHISKKSLGNR